jgi:hypothetical protein
VVYPGTLFHRRQRGIPMHSYENRSQIRALRVYTHVRYPRARRRRLDPDDARGGDADVPERKVPYYTRSLIQPPMQTSI